MFRPDGVFLCSRRLRCWPSVVPSFELFGLFCYGCSMVSCVIEASEMMVVASVKVVLDSFISSSIRFRFS